MLSLGDITSYLVRARGLVAPAVRSSPTRVWTRSTGSRLECRVAAAPARRRSDPACPAASCTAPGAAARAPGPRSTPQGGIGRRVRRRTGATRQASAADRLLVAAALWIAV